MTGNARVAELVDALDLGSSGETCRGSSPLSRTSIERYPNETFGNYGAQQARTLNVP